MTASASAETTVPGWLRRLGAISWRVLVIAGLAAVTIYVAVLLGTVTVSVLLSVVVASSFGPLVSGLRARGWSSTAASAAATGIAFLIALAALLIVIFWMIPELRGMATSISSGIEELQARLADLDIPPVIGNQLHEIADGVRAWIGTGLSDVVGAVGSIVTVAILSLFLTFFVLNDGEKAWVWMLQLADPRKRERIDVSGRAALERVGGYLRGTAILSAARAAAYAAFMFALGVPHIVPLAVVVLLGGFIPYIGPFIAMAAVILVALGTVGWQATLVLLVLMLIANGIVNNFLRPIVYSRSVSLHPAIILVAIPAGAAIAGIIGVFAAIPATAFLVAMGGALVEALEPDDRSDERLVAGWIDRLAQWSWRLLVAFGVIALMVFVVSQAPMVVIPVVVALIVAASIEPIARALRNRGWSPGRAAIVTIGGTYLAILILIAIAVVQIAGPVADAVGAAIASAGELEDDAGGALGWVQSLSGDVGANVLGAIATLLQVIAAAGVVLLISALLAFYFLRDGGRAWDAVLGRASAWRREALDRAGRDAVGILGGYMFGTAIISAVGAVSQLAIMVILGLPFAVPVAVLSFIACFIPYYGGFVTTGLAFLIAVGYGTPTQILIMFIYTIVFNLIQGNVVTPLVYNRAVNLHPAIVLLAIPAGGAIAGIAGMFLVVPVLGIIAATWRAALYAMGDRPSAQRPMAPTPEPAAVDPVVEGGLPASAD